LNLINIFFQEDTMPGSGLQFAFKESLSAVTATKPTDLALGTLRYESYLGEQCQWVYVYNGGGAQISPTYGVTPVTNASGAYSMTVTSIASWSVMRGLVVHATLTTATYGWVLKRGTATFIAGNTSFQAGRGIIASVDGTFDNATAISGQSADIGVISVCGTAIDSFATGTSGLGYLSFI
jgi:hypothetical protein